MTTHSADGSFTTNIHGPNYGGIQQGGQGNIQNITLTSNPNFNEAIAKLTELVKTSSLNEFDKEDVIRDVERLQQLASKEKKPDVIDRAQKKLEAIKTGIEVGEKGGQLALKAAPYLATLWQLITNVNS